MRPGKHCPDSACRETALARQATLAMNGGNLDGPSLRMLLAVSATIVIANFLIGIFAPITTGLDDEIAFFDTLWRIVAGQRFGIDYHTYGFGPYQVGALLWHWLGPHYFVMRISIALFCLAIAACGCIVTKRRLAHRPVLAWLFCVTLAFQVSSPSIYPDDTALSIAGFYNRLANSTLAILFLHTFGGEQRSRSWNVTDVALTAVLLNILFLTKISGLAVGFVIFFAGCLLQRLTFLRILSLCVALFAFVAITVAELKIAGIEYLSLMQDYELAARARLTYSFYHLAKTLAFFPFASSVALLLFLAVAHAMGERRVDALRICLLIGSYAVCQFALNITTDLGGSIWLAPAAVASLAGWPGAQPMARPADVLDRKRPTFSFSQLTEISLRDAIPFLIFAWVLIPQVVGSLVGLFVGSLVSLGIESSYVVGQGKGIKFTVLEFPRAGVGEYESSLNDAASAIASLNLDRQVIANLDFPNPFPVLFLAPPPKGVHAWFFWGFIMPRGTVLQWQAIIGDACVVTMPTRPISPRIADPVAEMVRPKLAVDFKTVYRDDLWTIYRRTEDCNSVPGP